MDEKAHLYRLYWGRRDWFPFGPKRCRGEEFKEEVQGPDDRSQVSTT